MPSSFSVKPKERGSTQRKVGTAGNPPQDAQLDAVGPPKCHPECGVFAGLSLTLNLFLEALQCLLWDLSHSTLCSLDVVVNPGHVSPHFAVKQPKPSPSAFTVIL